jgi:branched-chain amino acid transport system permease protein
MYYLRRAWAELKNEVLVLPSRTLVLAWVVFLLGLPLAYDDAYVLRILTMTCIFAIFAASWDMLAGYTGQVNFGHALFFGAGAYTSGLLSQKLGISPWATLWAGAAVATLIGWVVGFLCGCAARTYRSPRSPSPSSSWACCSPSRSSPAASSASRACGALC